MEEGFLIPCACRSSFTLAAVSWDEQRSTDSSSLWVSRGVCAWVQDLGLRLGHWSKEIRHCESGYGIEGIGPFVITGG